MSGTNSNPATAPLPSPLPVDDDGTQALLTALTATVDNGVDVNIVSPNPLIVDPSTRPKVHAGVFYLVRAG